MAAADVKNIVNLMFASPVI